MHGHPRANIFGCASARLLRSDDQFGALQDRITANQLALIRSFLIDSECLRALRTVICAKVFHRADALLQTGLT